MQKLESLGLTYLKLKLSPRLIPSWFKHPDPTVSGFSTDSEEKESRSISQTGNFYYYGRLHDFFFDHDFLSLILNWVRKNEGWLYSLYTIGLLILLHESCSTLSYPALKISLVNDNNALIEFFKFAFHSGWANPINQNKTHGTEQGNKLSTISCYFLRNVKSNYRVFEF